jgi:hypothetical protein
MSDLLDSSHSSLYLHYIIIDDILATVISPSSLLLSVLISLCQHHVRQRDLHKPFKKYVLSQRHIRIALCFHSMIASTVHHYYIVSPKFGGVWRELHKKELLSTFTLLPRDTLRFTRAVQLNVNRVSYTQQTVNNLAKVKIKSEKHNYTYFYA